MRLIPAQFVRPFVKSNKNDYRDAEFIAEAEGRENMPFRAHQDRRPARRAGSASGARMIGVATNQRDQSDSSVSVGARH